VRSGAAADIVVVEGDPTQAIARVRQVRAVYAAGRPVDLDRLRTR
jgi:imidazolonepropionase-like amidohydrolase